MSTFISRTVIVILMINSAAVDGKTCGIGQYLNKRGKCRDCEICQPGKGMNFSMEVALNTCHPCKKCQDGYFNDPAYGQYECILCRLNCITMNRKEYEPCGGTKPGVCGGCINSLYEDRENNLDSPCTKRKEAVESAQPETNAKVLPQEDSQVKEDLNNSGSTVNHNRELVGGLVAAALVVGVLMVCVLVIHTISKKRNSSHRCNKIASEQSRTLLASTRQINDGVAKEQYNTMNLDLEIDCPSDNGTANERNAYEELQNYNSSGPSELQIVSETSSLDARKPSRTYPKTVVTEGDKYFTYLSKHLYGDAVSQVFRALEVRDQNIFAQLELYRLETINYQDAIYRLLLHWCRLKTKNARLDVICPILDQTGLGEVSQQMLALVFEQSSSHSENQANKTTGLSETDNTVSSYNQTNNSVLEEPAQHVERQSDRFEQKYPLESHSLHSLSLLSCDKLGECEDEE